MSLIVRALVCMCVRAFVYVSVTFARTRLFVCVGRCVCACERACVWASVYVRMRV